MPRSRTIFDVGEDGGGVEARVVRPAGRAGAVVAGWRKAGQSFRLHLHSGLRQRGRSRVAYPNDDEAVVRRGYLRST